MNNVELFMFIYMYELEHYLNEHSEELLKLSFQLDEANTDRPLKEYMKNVIENNCCRIDKFSYISTIVVENKINIAIDEIKSMFIKRVLLPEEITSYIRDILKQRKKSVFTNPDLCLEIDNNGLLEYETVELKSTKINSILGSSVQQVLPKEWVIFVNHNTRNKSVEIVTGQYMNAINSKIQFPDRSPRPQISFKELKKWNSENRKIVNNNICYNISDNNNIEILYDWQGVLANNWLDIVFKQEKRKNEPWFNNNLRIFILKFLNTYDMMNAEEKERYRELLKTLIE